MTILKNGTPTGFQDRNGQEIKIADRIKHTNDGSIYTIDKFTRACSVLGFKYDLPNLGNISRGMNEDGTYFARLTEYELTDEEPAKPQGEVITAEDVDSFARPEPHDTRDTTPKSKHYKTKAVKVMAAETVANDITKEEAIKALTLADYQDEDLCDELRARGYHGEITKTKTIKI